MSFDVPLLLIAWRRPHTLRQVIDAIRPVAPTRLFVACDGPNPDRPGEAEKVEATKKVIEEEIDWPCQIERLYSDVNQGCRLGVSRAITWFFEQVEEGIILEDDVVPYPEFFDYCSICLEKYREDLRIWGVSANHTLQENRVISKITDLPLHLRYNFSVWGWATWSNRWSGYSSELDSRWFEANSISILSFCGQKSGFEIIKRARLGSSKTIDTWDYQVGAIQASLLSYSIHPSISLIRNIGFDADSTHTFRKASNAVECQSSGSLRSEWILQVYSFMNSEYILPPFIRDVSDIAYRRKGVLNRILAKAKSFFNDLKKSLQTP